MKHKYLEDAGIKDHPWNGWNHPYEKKDLEEFEKQREEYGFDSRECFSLDSTLLMLLYERLLMLKEDSKDTIDWENSQHITYKDKDYTTPQIIDYIVDNIEKYFGLKGHSVSDCDLDTEWKRQNEALDEIFGALRVSFNALWW